MTPLRGVLAIVVIVILGAGILGIGAGEAEYASDPPSASAVAAAEQRVASGGEAVQAGKELFSSEGCDRCHAIAAIGAKGELGPRLDDQPREAEPLVAFVRDPGEDNVMPKDYGERMSDPELRALGAFVAAATTVQGGGGNDG